MHRIVQLGRSCAGLVVLSLMMHQGPAAAWPNSPLVNVPVSTAKGDQGSVHGIPDGAGGMIVTWLDERDGLDGIYAQRISASGEPLWAIDGVAVQASTGSAHSAETVSDEAGGVILVWYDRRNGNTDLYAQRVAADGSLLWAPAGVAVCSAVGDQQIGRVIADGTGGMLVSWDNRHDFPDHGGPDDVFVQRIDGNGSLLWGPSGVTLCTAAADQNVGGMLSDGMGGAIVFWEDQRSGNSDIYAQRVSGAGSPQWTANGVAVCSEGGSQSFAHANAVVPDDAGGAIIAWYDLRTGVAAMYAQRVSSNGAVQWPVNGVPVHMSSVNETPGGLLSDGAGGAIATWYTSPNGHLDLHAQRMSPAGDPLWSADGIPLTTANGDQYPPQMISDGASGAVFAWQDQRSGNWDVYVQHVRADGNVVGARNGIPLCTSNGDQYPTSLVSDGDGGGVVVWQDHRTDSWDVYAQRLASDGTPSWTTNGVALCTAAGDQMTPQAVTDEDGGIIAAWRDGRSGGWDVYAQRLARDGVFNGPEPRIVSVKDVPRDQGGWVRIQWQASYLDTLPIMGIAVYGLWRQVEAAALGAIGPDGKLVGGVTVAGDARPLVFRVTTNGTTTRYWEGVGTVAARGLAMYAFTAPTFMDSTAEGNPYSVFMVDAHSTTWAEFWSSSRDSGYSVDNMPPLLPTPFIAQVAAGGISLQWGANREHDLAGYRIYRGRPRDFAPGSATYVTATLAPGYIDAAGSVGDSYKIAAVDVHDNVSPFATATVDGGTSTLISMVSSDVIDGVVRVTWSASAYPGATWSLERQSPGAAWLSLDNQDSNALGIVTFEDRSARAGESYAYRTRGIIDGVEVVSSPIILSLPSTSLALEGVRPNPFTLGKLELRYSLASSAPARLELIDVAGRILGSRSVGTLGAGAHKTTLEPMAGLPAGIYFVRLTQDDRWLVTRFAIVR